MLSERDGHRSIGESRQELLFRRLLERETVRELKEPWDVDGHQEHDMTQAVATAEVWMVKD